MSDFPYLNKWMTHCEATERYSFCYEIFLVLYNGQSNEPTRRLLSSEIVSTGVGIPKGREEFLRAKDIGSYRKKIIPSF